ncbi:hypothetical protein B0H11DRAFT_2224702 [Mycena galericulata]|nr:hypothetical protein B0H11DRAFT_2224702 [Mycena galericulata]
MSGSFFKFTACRVNAAPVPHQRRVNARQRRVNAASMRVTAASLPLPGWPWMGG